MRISLIILISLIASASAQNSAFVTATSPCGWPGYACSNTSLATLSNYPSAPSIPGLVHFGTTFTDPLYGTKGVFVTDACFDPQLVKPSASCPNGTSVSDNTNNSYSVSNAGSADDQEFNVGVVPFLLGVTSQGNRRYIVGFSPKFTQVTRPYALSTSGCPSSVSTNCSLTGGWATTGGLAFALSDPCTLYVYGNDATIQKYVFGSDVVPFANPCSGGISGPPAATQVFNFIENSPPGCVGTACNCLPSDFGSPIWVDSGGGTAFGDTLFSNAFGSSKYYYAGPAWVLTNAYTLNFKMQPVNNNASNNTFQVTVAGTSGGTEPNWGVSCGSLNNTCTDGGVTWKNLGNTTPVIQGTGIYVVQYSPGKGCASYNTETGSIHADVGWAGAAGLTCNATQCSGTSTATGRHTIHNVKNAKSGNYVVVAPSVCISGTCPSSNPWNWYGGGTTVYPSQGTLRTGGHWASASLGVVNSPGSPLFQFWYHAQTSSASGTPVAVNAVPSPACLTSLDNHSAYQSADPNDLSPFAFATNPGTSATSGLVPFDPPICAWDGELALADRNGSGLVHREFFFFNSGYSEFFNSAQSIFALAPAGSYAAGGTDWLNNLRNAAGTSTSCVPNGPDWKTVKSYASGYTMNPSLGNAGNFSYRVAGSCVSGVTEPGTWNQTLSGTQADGTCTWTNLGVPTGTVNECGTDVALWGPLN